MSKISREVKEIGWGICIDAEGRVYVGTQIGKKITLHTIYRVLVK